MTRYTFEELFAQEPLEGHLQDVQYVLGDVARWWLRPELLGELPRPMTCPTVNDLPDAEGSCWPIFAVNDLELTGEGQGSGLLRSAFVLPLEWHCLVEAVNPGVELGEGLPVELLPIAEGVWQAMSPQHGIGERRWKLTLAFDSEGIVTHLDELKFLPHQFDSAWASLASGLWCAATTSKPERTAWSTGCWSAQIENTARNRGFTLVGDKTLPAKVRHAHELGAKYLFVPASQSDDADAARPKPTTLTIGELSTKDADPARAMSSLFASLKARPDKEAKFPIRQRYYLELCGWVGDRDSRSVDFLQEYLFADVISECHLRFQRQVLDEERIDLTNSTLVTLMSGSPMLIAQNAGILGVANCCVLVTEGYRDDYRKSAEQWCSKLADISGATCQFRFLDDYPIRMDEKFLSHFQLALEPLLQSTEPGQLIFDLTPGKKLHAEALRSSFARKKDWLVYAEHLLHQGRAPVPGSQQLLMWQAGSKPDLSQLVYEGSSQT